MSARTRIRIAVGTLTAATLFGAGIALAGSTAAADETTAPSLDEIMYEGPVNDLLMPVGDVIDLVDPAGVEEQQGEDETLTAPASQEPTAAVPTDPPARRSATGSADLPRPSPVQAIPR